MRRVILLAGLTIVSLVAGGQDRSHDATVRHRFEDVARWKAVFDDPARDEWQKPAEVVARLGLAAGDRVADLGAGTGYFSVRLARAVGPTGRVWAVDIEPALVAHLRERATAEELPWIEPVLAASDDPGLPSGEVDLVFVCDTWHHIDDRLDYLRTVARALAPGGRVAVVDFREGDLPVGPPAGHKLGRGEVVGEFEAAGWSLAAEEGFLPYQYMLVFRPPAQKR